MQANMDIVNPFLISTNGYGVLWDNYSSTKFEDTKEGYSFTSEVGDASDYYFVYGKDMDEVVAGYRELTGTCRCLENGYMASGSPKSVISRSMN
ncbi:hypothetical protein SFC43_26500 [Bacteroides sp. CR5/BHMF/2]|nr:hypothetical protein [Bacteroides sp. CR5/BHMF/2]